MTTPDQRVTLKLSRPKNLIVLHAILIFLILAVICEAIGRSPLVQDRVPYQAYGINHTQMEIELTMLDAFVRANGAPDCFIFGSSQAFRDLDPGAFTQSYEANGGKPLTCYNFGITGSQVATTAVLNKILVQRYKPKLVIIGTSFLDYTRGRELQIDERFTKSEWLKYETGGFSISGWLTAHSYAWRFLTLVSYSAQYGMNYTEVLREAHKWDGEIAPSGFALSISKTNPLIPVDQGFVKNLTWELGDYSISPRNIAAMEQIIVDSQSAGARVVVVEMPYHPALLDLKDNHGRPRIDRRKILAYRNEVNARIASITQTHQAVFIQTETTLSIPNDVWYDLYHLNRNGAELFSQWLGARLAKIPDLVPTLPNSSGG